MIESLLVIPVLLVFLGGAARLHHYYHAKWSALQQARANAWALALPGCLLPEEIKELADNADTAAEDDTTRRGGVQAPPSDADSPIGSTMMGDASNPPAFLRRAEAGEGSATVPLRPAAPGLEPSANTRITLDGAVTATRSFSCNEMHQEDELVISGTTVVKGIMGAAKDILRF